MKLLPFHIKDRIFLLAALVFYTLLTLAVLHNGFFWDSVLLSSRYASWFYDQGFTKFILPDNLDAIHPPTFGLYLAVFWKIFGKSLIVSHLAILPFLWGIVWQLFRLARLFFPGKHLWMVFLLVIADVTLVGQSTMVSPDVALVFLFLWSLNATLHSQRWQLAVASILLGFVSIRGMFAVLSIFISDLYINYKVYPESKPLTRIFKISITYVPAGILVFLFLAWHYAVKGWILPIADTRWPGHYDFTGITGIIYNFGIICWRLIDFGRIFLWLPVPFILWNWWIKKQKVDPKFTLLFWLFMIFMLANAPYLVFFKQPIGHRYLVPAYLLFAMWISFGLLETFDFKKYRYLVYGLILAGLVSGNFWIYPEGISKGWDSTPAHLPYYKLRTKMITYIDQNHIPISAIGSDFPNNNKFCDMDLNNRTEAFPLLDMKTQQYIFYSNIFNGFSKEDTRELNTKWILLKEYRKCRIVVGLYKKPEKLK
jgi:hypothetical protein